MSWPGASPAFSTARSRGDGETAALAALLEQAAESARLDVPQAEVERVLAGLQPRVVEPRVRTDRRRRPSVRAGLAFAGVAAAAAVAIALLVVAPFGGLDVAAEANAALAEDDVVLSLVERVSPAEPGTFRESTRTGWLDLENGRARWTQEVFGRTSPRRSSSRAPCATTFRSRRPSSPARLAPHSRAAAQTWSTRSRSTATRWRSPKSRT